MNQNSVNLQLSAESQLFPGVATHFHKLMPELVLKKITKCIELPTTSTFKLFGLCILVMHGWAMFNF